MGLFWVVLMPSVLIRLVCLICGACLSWQRGWAGMVGHFLRPLIHQEALWTKMTPEPTARAVSSVPSGSWVGVLGGGIQYRSLLQDPCHPGTSTGYENFQLHFAGLNFNSIFMGASRFWHGASLKRNKEKTMRTANNCGCWHLAPISGRSGMPSRCAAWSYFPSHSEGCFNELNGAHSNV